MFGERSIAAVGLDGEDTSVIGGELVDECAMDRVDDLIGLALLEQKLADRVEREHAIGRSLRRLGQGRFGV